MLKPRELYLCVLLCGCFRVTGCVVLGLLCFSGYFLLPNILVEQRIHKPIYLGVFFF